MDLDIAVPRPADQTHVLCAFAGVQNDPDNRLCVKVESDPVVDPCPALQTRDFVLPWRFQRFSHEIANLNRVRCAMNVSLLHLLRLLFLFVVLTT